MTLILTCAAGKYREMFSPWSVRVETNNIEVFNVCGNMSAFRRNSEKIAAYRTHLLGVHHLRLVILVDIVTEFNKEHMSRLDDVARSDGVLLGMDWRCWVGAPCPKQVMEAYTLPYWLNTGLIAGQNSQVGAFLQMLMKVDVALCAGYTNTDATADQALAYCAIKHCTRECPTIRIDAAELFIQGTCARHSRKALFTHRWGGVKCKHRLPMWRALSK